MNKVLTTDESPVNKNTRVITMGPQGFGLLQRATEWYARVGLGQLQVFGELLRDGRTDWFNPNEKNEYGSSMRCLNGIDFFCNLIKRDALKLSIGSSLGINSPHLPLAIKRAWELQAAVRHRMVWDRTIEDCEKYEEDEEGMVPGHLSVGVWHDDPAEPHEDHQGLHQGLHQELLVLSQPIQKPESGKVIEVEASPKRHLIRLGADHRKAAREALQSYARALHCDATVFHDLMKSARIVKADGSGVTGSGLYAALSNGIRIRELCQVKNLEGDQNNQNISKLKSDQNSKFNKYSKNVKIDSALPDASNSLILESLEDIFLLGELARAFSEPLENFQNSQSSKSDLDTGEILENTDSFNEIKNLWVFDDPSTQTLAFQSLQRSGRPGEHFSAGSTGSTGNTGNTGNCVEQWINEALKSLPSGFIAVKENNEFCIFSEQKTIEENKGQVFAQSTSLQTAICKARLKIFKSKRIKNTDQSLKQNAGFWSF